MIIELNGRWTLRQNDSDEPIAAQVPGCVHTDLLAAGKIPDPFVGDNEEALRWIFQDRWTYQREFDLPAEFLQQARIFLCCEGLDTIAHLTLNGKLLGTTDNMFRHWEFDVKSFLVPGMNQIEIRFDSPSAYIENRQKIRPMIYPTAQHQVAAFSQIRKAAFSFGWDWGPCLPTSGIWQPIYLRAIDAGRLRDVSTRQDHTNPRRVKVSVAVQVESEAATEMSARVTLNYGEEVIAREICPIAGSSHEGSIDLWVEDPHLWWPNGMELRRFMKSPSSCLMKPLSLSTCGSAASDSELCTSIADRTNGVMPFPFTLMAVPSSPKAPIGFRPTPWSLESPTRSIVGC